MGLSEDEKRVLEELERNLYADDLRFAKKSRATIERVSASAGPNSPAKIVAGALIGVIGVSILVFAAITQIALFGVAGFLIMLFGILMASATRKVDQPSAKKQPKQATQARGSFFEERWNKRNDN